MGLWVGCIPHFGAPQNWMLPKCLFFCRLDTLDPTTSETGTHAATWRLRSTDLLKMASKMKESLLTVPAATKKQILFRTFLPGHGPRRERRHHTLCKSSAHWLSLEQSWEMRMLWTQYLHQDIHVQTPRTWISPLEELHQLKILA